MGLVLSIIFKTIIGILGAGYFIELALKAYSKYRKGETIKQITPITIAAIVSLYIVVWLNHDYMSAILSGMSFVGNSLICTVKECNNVEIIPAKIETHSEPAERKPIGNEPQRSDYATTHQFPSDTASAESPQVSSKAEDTGPIPGLFNALD